MKSCGDGAVKVLEEEVEYVVVNAPVFLDFLETKKAELGAVFGDALGHADVAADTEGMNAKGSKESSDPG